MINEQVDSFSESIMSSISHKKIMSRAELAQAVFLANTKINNLYHLPVFRDNFGPLVRICFQVSLAFGCFLLRCKFKYESEDEKMRCLFLFLFLVIIKYL